MSKVGLGAQTAEGSSGGTVSLTILTVELDYQGRSDYQPVYLGTNLPGANLTDTTWNIRYLTYDSDSRVDSIQNATGAWTNRTSLTYD